MPDDRDVVFCKDEWHVPTVTEASARRYIPLNEDFSIMVDPSAPKRQFTPVETHVIPDEEEPPRVDTPRQDNDAWGSPEEQASWLRPGTQHYMNATPNSTKNKSLARTSRDAYVQVRGYHEYDVGKLKGELVAYIGSSEEGEQITEMISPPELAFTAAARPLVPMHFR